MTIQEHLISEFDDGLIKKFKTVSPVDHDASVSEVNQSLDPLSFNFRIQMNQVLQENDNNITFPSNYKYHLDRAILEVYKACVHHVKYKRINKKQQNAIVAMYCVYKECRRLKCLLLYGAISEDGYISVECTVQKGYHKIKHEGTMQFKQIRSYERKLVKNELLNKKAFKKREESINSANLKQLAKKVAPGITTVGALQTMRSEALCSADADKNDLADIQDKCLQQKDNDNYIEEIITNSKSAAVYLLCKDFTEKISSLFEDRGFIILNLDSTGAVVRNLNRNIFKQCYYYAAVVNYKDDDLGENHTLPITEMVSTSHTTTTIARWLFSFKIKYAREHIDRNNLPFSIVVVDYSWALML